MSIFYVLLDYLHFYEYRQYNGLFDLKQRSLTKISGNTTRQNILKKRNGGVEFVFTAGLPSDANANWNSTFCINKRQSTILFFNALMNVFFPAVYNNSDLLVRKLHSFLRQSPSS